MTGAAPRWITKAGIILLHDRSLALHGGPSGLRDEGLLESALARPLNRHLHEGIEDIAELAATYALALSSNHPFIDGNKRTAFLAMGLFLEKNGLRLVAGQVDATLTVLKLAAGETDIDGLAAWLRARPARRRASSPTDAVSLRDRADSGKRCIQGVPPHRRQRSSGHLPCVASCSPASRSCF
jgi:death-on-curing protein